MKNHKTTDTSIKTSIPGNNFLFTTGSLVILAGLLFPITGVWSDILLSFCILINVAIGLIGFSNTPADELKGFSGVSIIASAARIFTAVSAVKLILTGSASSLIAQYLARPLLSNLLLSVFLLGALLLVLLGMAVRQSHSVLKLISDFFEKTLRVKQLYIESARRTHIISEEDAAILQGQTERTSHFFSQAAGATRFAFCESILHGCIYCIGIVGVFLVSATESSQQSISVFSALCELSVIFTLIMLLAVNSVFSLASVSKKCYRATQIFEEDRDESQGQKVKSVTNELIDDPFSKDDVSGHTNGLSRPLLKTGQRMLWQSHNLKTKSHYEFVSQVLQSESFNHAKIILMAGDSNQALPVTIPANLAIRLSQAGLSCLLVDLDIHRESIAQAFEAKPPDYKAGKFLVKSNFKRVALLLADLIKRMAPDKVSRLIDLCAKKYDRIILYAPQISESDKVSTIAACCTSAMLFSQHQDNPFMQQLRKSLENRGCDILEPDEILIELESESVL